MRGDADVCVRVVYLWRQVPSPVTTVETETEMVPVTVDESMYVALLARETLREFQRTLAAFRATVGVRNAG